MKPRFCLILRQQGVFPFTNCKVCIFYQWCLSGLSSQQYVSMIFVKQFGKKMHTLQRSGLIFYFQMPYFLHWLFSSTLLTQLKPAEASEQAAKKSRALPSSSRRGLRALDPANPSSEKKTSQPTCFCCAYFSKSVMNLHWLFNLSCINTHFHMFFKN